MLNIRRIAPVAALAVITALTLSACGASAVVSESNGLTMTMTKTGEGEIPADFLESYPTEGKACVYDVTIENTSDEFVNMQSAQFDSEAFSPVGMETPAGNPDKGTFWDAVGDVAALESGLDAGESLEFTKAVACIATDAVLKIGGGNGIDLVEASVGH